MSNQQNHHILVGFADALEEDNPAPEIKIVKDRILKALVALGISSGGISHGARIQHQGVQQIPNNVITAINMFVEVHDSGNFFNPSNPTRLTFAKPGVYLITGNIAWAINATGGRLALLRINGNKYIASNGGENGGGVVNGAVTVTTIYRVAANDYVELLGWQNSGGQLQSQATWGCPSLSCQLLSYIP